MANKIISLAVTMLLAFGGGVVLAHETNSAGANLAQTLVSHADVSISAAATSHYLNAKANRVTALCYNTGIANDARVGDSSVGAARGIPLPPATANGVAYVALDSTDDLYIYSANGTTVGCLEVVRP